MSSIGTALLYDCDGSVVRDMKLVDRIFTIGRRFIVGDDLA
jgi:hypothetical protein